ncbi:hypothetical protein B296_00024098 [Ensete ventricosum]|uniref:Uncharacterized protein n=1 Tax=Ensete ventricosum TaxID=4639 RepID=A0A426YE94_ENSVE|nr:hypothetical protein B296_00024098 [Ensete ventricosum]
MLVSGGRCGSHFRSQCLTSMFPCGLPPGFSAAVGDRSGPPLASLSPGRRFSQPRERTSSPHPKLTSSSCDEP